MYANDNGGEYPMIGWKGSHTDSWADLEDMLGTTLPVDPLNTSDITDDHAAREGNFVYSYIATNAPVWCKGKVYVLAFSLEGKKGDGDNDGVTRCDDTLIYGDAFVVGMDKNGRLKTPDLSGTSK
jgi:hypothetical protein